MEFHFDNVRSESVTKRNNVETAEEAEEAEEEDERAPPAKRAKMGAAAAAAEHSQREFEIYARAGLYTLEKPRQTTMFTGTFAEFVARNSSPMPTKPPVAKLSASAPESLEEWFARLSIV